MAGGENVAEHLREQMILAILVRHPGLARSFESQLEEVHLGDPLCDRLRHILLRHAHDPEDRIEAALAEGAQGDLEKLMALPHVRVAPPVIKRDDPDLARLCLAEELAKLEAERAMRAEVIDAMEDLEGLADEGVTWRLAEAARARNSAGKPKLDDTSDMGEDRAALSAQLQALIDGEVWRKKRS